MYRALFLRKDDEGIKARILTNDLDPRIINVIDEDAITPLLITEEGIFEGLQKIQTYCEIVERDKGEDMSIEQAIEAWLVENGYDGCGVRCPSCGEESDVSEVIFEPYICIGED